MSNFEFDTGEGDSLTIPFISPKTYLDFFVNNCIDLVAGGAESYADCKIQLESFWAAYKQYHGNHRIFLKALKITIWATLCLLPSMAMRVGANAGLEL